LGVPNISIDQLGTSNIVNQPTIAPASIWTARTAVQTNNWATSVTYGNGLFVAASGNGSANGSNIMTSTDGITWTAQMSSNLNIWANSVTYGKGLFIAVAGNGDNQVMTSPDGIIWTAQMASSANNWASVTYGNGLFVAIANNGDNQVMTSPDGITWIDRMVSNANSWASVTYGNGLFVTVGTGVMTSHDGINWKSETITPNNNGWGSIVYGNGLFVAVAKTADINNVMTSPDGTNWTLQNLPEINTWYSVTYGNGLFVAVAGGFGTNQIMTSPDGINWTILLEPISDDWTSVSYGNNTFVALSSLGSVMTSPDYGGNYIYDYTVNQADGTNYIDGEAVVSLSPVTDVLGNPSQAPTNTTFTIDTVSPSIPVASPTSGTYTGTQSITLTSVGSDSFRYSTTEAPANCSADTLYASPIEISSTSTLYAIACDNAGNSSSSTFDYVINTPVVIASSSNHSSGGSTLEFRNKFIAEQKALLEAQTNTTVTPPTTPVVSGTLFITKTLKLKVTSNEVKELQKYLNTNGYVLASLGAGSLGKETTYFGPATKKAVIAFQKANKLAADGIVGKMTASLMK